jgi:hypothetical protein
MPASGDQPASVDQPCIAAAEESGAMPASGDHALALNADDAMPASDDQPCMAAADENGPLTPAGMKPGGTVNGVKGAVETLACDLE